ncbi:hypothetical protein CCP4SC76_5960003 [Gammaproteobacteria bacterium]
MRSDKSTNEIWGDRKYSKSKDEGTSNKRIMSHRREKGK